MSLYHRASPGEQELPCLPDLTVFSEPGIFYACLRCREGAHREALGCYILLTVENMGLWLREGGWFEDASLIKAFGDYWSDCKLSPYQPHVPVIL